MATRTKKVETEDEKAFKSKVKELVGVKYGIDVSFDKASDSFLITIGDYSVRTSARFKRDFASHFEEAPKWNSELKGFPIPASQIDRIRTAVETTRRYAEEIFVVRENWLRDLKGKLFTAVNKFEQETFNERLQAAMAYRADHPEEVAQLPKLPNGYVEPVIKDVYANTREGSWSNGQIVGYNDYFVAQYTGRGKLSEDRVSKLPDHYLTLHPIDKFLHSPEDWRNPRQALERALGTWENGQWKCVEYNAHAKAVVHDYDRNYHSVAARQAQREAQHYAEQAKQTPSQAPSPTVRRMQTQARKPQTMSM